MILRCCWLRGRSFSAYSRERVEVQRGSVNTEWFSILHSNFDITFWLREQARIEPVEEDFRGDAKRGRNLLKLLGPAPKLALKPAKRRSSPGARLRPHPPPAGLSSPFTRHQQLRGGRRGDHRRVLALDARQSDRADELSERRLR
jgi:hypothetical protein